MEFDYSKLNGKIVEVFGAQYNFAEAMGVSERTISLKLNGKVGWKDHEMYKASDLLGFKIDLIPNYFFKEKVHEQEHHPKEAMK